MVDVKLCTSTLFVYNLGIPFLAPNKTQNIINDKNNANILPQFILCFVFSINLAPTYCPVLTDNEVFIDSPIYKINVNIESNITAHDIAISDDLTHAQYTGHNENINVSHKPNTDIGIDK